jgi:hypothetical protein
VPVVTDKTAAMLADIEGLSDADIKNRNRIYDENIRIMRGE